MPEKKPRYWAIRFLNDPRYRLTVKRFATPSAACRDLFGVPFDDARMAAVGFNVEWQNLSIGQKLEIEAALGLPKEAK